MLQSEKLCLRDRRQTGLQVGRCTEAAEDAWPEGTVLPNLLPNLLTLHLLSVVTYQGVGTGKRKQLIKNINIHR